MSSTIILLTDGGFRGIKGAVGKRIKAKQLRGMWYVDSAELDKAGASTLVPEYVFFQREVEVVWHMPVS